MKVVRSFDVFDTCLTRRTAVPTGVFFDAARKAFKTLNVTPSRTQISDFVSARIEAERLARRQTKSEEVTLDEIWKILLASLGWPASKALIDCELEAEAEALVSVRSLMDGINNARANGERILFVSDMYLPAEFIEMQLTRHGFARPGDGIYVSSKIGKTKASGNLFRHLLAQEQLTAADLLHTGDNVHSDYNVPRNLGVRVQLCDPAKLTPTEEAVLAADDDLEKVSRIAGEMRAFRVSKPEAERDSLFELASQFAGPFITGLAIWTLKQAQEKKVKRLYFLSRDGQLLGKAAETLAPKFGNIECRYLYVSRQSLFLPSAESISPEGMPWMRRQFEEPVLRKLLAKLDLKYESVETSLGGMAGNLREDYQLKNEEDWATFWKTLNTEPVKTQIENLVITRRNVSRKYFEQAGLLDDVSWAIVDLGWTLACQRALWTLLKQWGWEKTIQGFYFGLFIERVGPKTAGQSEALFYRQPPDFPKNTKINSVFSRVTLLEHIIGYADHPTVHHHERLPSGEISPAYASIVEKSTLEFCARLHQKTLEFVDHSPEMVAAFEDASICRNVLAALVINFFTFPSEKAANALLGLSATEDQNGLNPLPIVKAFDWKKTLTPFSSKADAFTQTRNSFWLEGSIAITPVKIQKMLNLTQRVANRFGRLRNLF